MEGLSRREALRMTAGCGLVGLCAQGCSSRAAGQQDNRGSPPSSGAAATPQRPRGLAAVSAVVPGRALDVSAAAGKPAYIVRRQDTVRMLSAICTHSGCLVAWNQETKHFVCPCHGGTYDLQGAVVSGPPPRPLDELPVTVENGKVYLAPR